MKTLFVLALLALPLQLVGQEDDMPESPAGAFKFETVFQNDGKLVRVVKKQISDTPTTEITTFNVLVERDGRTVMETRQRSKTVYPSIKIFEEVHADWKFYDVDKNEVDREEVMKRVPETGLQILHMVGTPELQTELKDLLRDDVLILVLPHKKQPAKTDE